MDQRIPGRERDLPAGYAPDWETKGSEERNGLRLGIVRVHYVEMLFAKEAA